MKVHSLIPIAEHLANGGESGGTSGSTGGSEHMCPKHPQYPLEFFCNTCNEVVCGSCVGRAHNGHSLVDVSAALATETAAMEASVAAATAALAAAKTGIVAVREMKRAVQTNAHATHQEVESHCKALQRKLIVRMKELQGDVSVEAERKRELLQAQLDGLERVETKLEAGIAVAARLHEHGTAIERLQGRGLVVEGLAAAVGHGVGVDPVVGPTVEFVVQQELQGMSEMLVGYGVIAGVDTKASVSGAVGEGIVQAAAHQEATFVVAAVGYDGHPQTKGGDVVAVTFGPAPVKGGGGGGVGGGGGGAAASADEPPSKRRKTTKASKGKQKQEAAAVSAAAAAPAAAVVGTVVDCGDGTYRCSYTPVTPPGAVADGGGGKGGAVWQLAVQIGGVHIAGSPFAVEMMPGAEARVAAGKATRARLQAANPAAHKKANAVVDPADGETKLWRAASAGEVAEVRALLQAGADPLVGLTTNGCTPVYLAAQNGHLEVVRALVEAGADVNAARTDGTWTPLKVAQRNNHPDVVALLKQAGARA